MSIGDKPRTIKRGRKSREEKAQQKEMAAAEEAIKNMDSSWKTSENYKKLEKEAYRRQMAVIQAAENSAAVWTLMFTEGRTRRETALLLGITTDAVDEALTHMAAEQTRRIRVDAQNYTARQLARYEWVIEQATAGYEQSKAGKRTVERQIRNPSSHETASAADPPLELLIERVEQTKHGDPRFLSIVLMSLKAQNDVLGLTKAKTEINQTVIQLSARERVERLLKVIDATPAEAQQMAESATIDLDPSSDDVMSAQDTDWAFGGDQRFTDE